MIEDTKPEIVGAEDTKADLAGASKEIARRLAGRPTDICDCGSRIAWQCECDRGPWWRRYDDYWVELIRMTVQRMVEQHGESIHYVRSAWWEYLKTDAPREAELLARDFLEMQRIAKLRADATPTEAL